MPRTKKNTNPINVEELMNELNELPRIEDVVIDPPETKNETETKTAETNDQILKNPTRKAPEKFEIKHEPEPEPAVDPNEKNTDLYDTRGIQDPAALRVDPYEKNMDLYNTYRQPPETALKTIQAGRLKGMTDINPMWRIQSLTEAFGPCGIGWYYEVVDTRREDAEDGTAAIFVSINLYVKYNGEWSKPIHGIGGSPLIASEKNGLRLSDEAAKMAETDALSIACKNLGFGADVWWAAGRTKYSAPVPSDMDTATQAFTPQCYEDGVYDVKVVNRELHYEVSAKGNPYVSCEFVIQNGPYAGYRLTQVKMMLDRPETKDILAALSKKSVPHTATLTKATIIAINTILNISDPTVKVRRMTKGFNGSKWTEFTLVNI